MPISTPYSAHIFITGHMGQVDQISRRWFGLMARTWSGNARTSPPLDLRTHSKYRSGPANKKKIRICPKNPKGIPTCVIIFVK